jgi:hypothetical protein
VDDEAADERKEERRGGKGREKPDEQVSGADSQGIEKNHIAPDEIDGDLSKKIRCDEAALGQSVGRLHFRAIVADPMRPCEAWKASLLPPPS